MAYSARFKVFGGRIWRSYAAAFLIVSPLGRTRETAAIDGVALDVPAAFDARLMERHFGEWGGLMAEEAAVRRPAPVCGRTLARSLAGSRGYPPARKGLYNGRSRNPGETRE